MAISKTAPIAAAKDMFDELQRLVEGIDRRVPHLERLDEATIAREDQLAADRVVMAVSRMGAARASAAAVKPTNKPKK